MTHETCNLHLAVRPAPLVFLFPLTRAGCFVGSGEHDKKRIFICFSIIIFKCSCLSIIMFNVFGSLLLLLLSKLLLQRLGDCSCYLSVGCSPMDWLGIEKRIKNTCTHTLYFPPVLWARWFRRNSTKITSPSPFLVPSLPISLLFLTLPTPARSLSRIPRPSSLPKPPSVPPSALLLSLPSLRRTPCGPRGGDGLHRPPPPLRRMETSSPLLSSFRSPLPHLSRRNEA